MIEHHSPSTSRGGGFVLLRLATLLLAISGMGMLMASAAKIPPLSGKPRCPVGWSHRTLDDRCYKLFSTNFTARNYEEADHYCSDAHQAELPMAYNRTTMDYLLDLIVRGSGRAVWLAIRNDPKNRKSPQEFIYPRTHRPYSSFFDWDKKRSMPDGEDCVALHAKGRPSVRVLGGNEKMITTSCYNHLDVVCVKDRVPPRINGVNGTGTGIVSLVWRQPAWLNIMGLHLPAGTRVTLQTTSEAYFATGPNQPTNCTRVPRTTGGSFPLTVQNVTLTRQFNKLCNGTCDSSIVFIPPTMPFVRGAKYSLCFFVPTFNHRSPLVDDEYAAINHLPGLFVQWVQRRQEYLTDICTRHQHSVDLFFGDHRLDSNRDTLNPFYFDSPVGG